MENDLLKKTLKLKANLKKTWQPFFGSFGKLREIQLHVIPEILLGRNVIVISPTAAGKTESVVAPMAETLLREGGKTTKGLKIIYIAPTRALVNDLFYRLSNPLKLLGISVARRTGDHHDLDLSNPEDFLLTTPESLDSLMTRVQGLFQSITHVVLDDLHLIDGTYRGDQLRVLLERLRLRKECASIQYAAMTATAAEPQTLAQRYFNPVTVVEAGTRRAVQLKLFETLQELVSYARKLKITKILFFTNSRIDAEVLFKSLSDLWPRDRILIHHGSLSKKIREEVEGTMRSWSWGICISTTTLEIGIDIGDIDAVAILYPPFFASSFQQRIGRGSRTKNEISVLGLYRDQGEKQIFELYCEMANLGLVEQSLYMPDLSVVVQQLFSILFERRRGITENELFTNVCTLCTRDEYSAILNYLISRQFLEERAMKILGSEKIMNLGERGLIHSNIPDSREREIVDFNTGRVMGKASIGVSGASYFVFAGRLWRAKEVTAKRIVAVQAGGSVEIKNFLKRPEKGAFSDYLPPDLREL